MIYDAAIIGTGPAGVSAAAGGLGRGVSYCATCDGNLYRDKTIGVICNAARFEHEVEYLANLAAKVYYVPLYQEVGITAPNVELRKDRALEILGEGNIAAHSVAEYLARRE